MSVTAARSVCRLEFFFFFQAEDGIRDLVRSRGLGDVYKRQLYNKTVELWTRATDEVTEAVKELLSPIEGLGAMARSGATKGGINLSLIHI